MLLDFHPTTDKKFSVRDSVFPDENGLFWVCAFKMKNIKKNYHLLSVLAKAKPAQRKAILKEASPDQISYL